MFKTFRIDKNTFEEQAKTGIGVCEVISELLGAADRDLTDLYEKIREIPEFSGYEYVSIKSDIEKIAGADYGNSYVQADHTYSNIGSQSDYGGFAADYCEFPTVVDAYVEDVDEPFLKEYDKAVEMMTKIKISELYVADLNATGTADNPLRSINMQSLLGEDEIEEFIKYQLEEEEKTYKQYKEWFDNNSWPPYITEEQKNQITAYIKQREEQTADILLYKQCENNGNWPDGWNQEKREEVSKMLKNYDQYGMLTYEGYVQNLLHSGEIKYHTVSEVDKANKAYADELKKEKAVNTAAAVLTFTLECVPVVGSLIAIGEAAWGIYNVYHHWNENHNWGELGLDLFTGAMSAVGLKAETAAVKGILKAEKGAQKISKAAQLGEYALKETEIGMLIGGGMTAASYGCQALGGSGFAPMAVMLGIQGGFAGLGRYRHFENLLKQQGNKNPRASEILKLMKDYSVDKVKTNSEIFKTSLIDTLNNYGFNPKAPALKCDEFMSIITAASIIPKEYLPYNLVQILYGAMGMKFVKDFVKNYKINAEIIPNIKVLEDLKKSINTSNAEKNLLMSIKDDSNNINTANLSSAEKNMLKNMGVDIKNINPKIIEDLKFLKDTEIAMNTHIFQNKLYEDAQKIILEKYIKNSEKSLDKITNEDLNNKDLKRINITKEDFGKNKINIFTENSIDNHVKADWDLLNEYKTYHSVQTKRLAEKKANQIAYAKLKNVQDCGNNIDKIKDIIKDTEITLSQITDGNKKIDSRKVDNLINNYRRKIENCNGKYELINETLELGRQNNKYLLSCPESITENELKDFMRQIVSYEYKNLYEYKIECNDLRKNDFELNKIKDNLTEKNLDDFLNKFAEGKVEEVKNIYNQFHSEKNKIRYLELLEGNYIYKKVMQKDLMPDLLDKDVLEKIPEKFDKEVSKTKQIYDLENDYDKFYRDTMPSEYKISFDENHINDYMNKESLAFDKQIKTLRQKVEIIKNAQRYALFNEGKYFKNWSEIKNLKSALEIVDDFLNPKKAPGTEDIFEKANLFLTNNNLNLSLTTEQKKKIGQILKDKESLEKLRNTKIDINLDNTKINKPEDLFKKLEFIEEDIYKTVYNRITGKELSDKLTLKDKENAMNKALEKISEACEKDIKAENALKEAVDLDGVNAYINKHPEVLNNISKEIPVTNTKMLVLKDNADKNALINLLHLNDKALVREGKMHDINEWAGNNLVKAKDLAEKNKEFVNFDAKNKKFEIKNTADYVRDKIIEASDDAVLWKEINERFNEIKNDTEAFKKLRKKAEENNILIDNELNTNKNPKEIIKYLWSSTSEVKLLDNINNFYNKYSNDNILAELRKIEDDGFIKFENNKITAKKHKIISEDELASKLGIIDKVKTLDDKYLNSCLNDFYKNSELTQAEKTDFINKFAEIKSVNKIDVKGEELKNIINTIGRENLSESKPKIEIISLKRKPEEELQLVKDLILKGENGARKYSNEQIQDIINMRNTKYKITLEDGRIIELKRYGLGTKSEGQAHHINQNKAFDNIILKEEGMTIDLEGNILREPGTTHYIVHKKIEEFWDKYEKRGYNPTANEIENYPTVGEYNEVVKEALIEAGYSPKDADAILSISKRQQELYGIKDTDHFEYIPGKINLADSLF